MSPAAFLVRENRSLQRIVIPSNNWSAGVVVVEDSSVVVVSQRSCMGEMAGGVSKYRKSNSIR